MLQVRMRSLKPPSPALSSDLMLKLSVLPETDGTPMRCRESSHGWPAPDWLWMLMDHWGALTKTELPGFPGMIMSGLPGWETTKRCPKAALFDLTETVQPPCMVILIHFLL